MPVRSYPVRPGRIAADCTLGRALTFDHVVVGAGSAGCVVAARLSEDPRRSVLLLEAGPADIRREIGIPAAFSRLFRTEYDWAYETAPQPGLDGRRLYWPRGRGLGGSSSINAMMWVRGVPADFDAWAAAGNAGWSYGEVVEYFRRIEDAVRHDPEHTGIGGPVRVEEQRSPNPGTHLFVAACQRAGIPRNSNSNAGTNEGVDYTQVFQRRGRRVSSAAAYLRPVMRRSNLTMETGALVTRVVLEGGRATGVAYVKEGQLRTARVRGDVVLSGGAVNSPQLLMLSGIGPEEHLRSVGIDPVVDLPGVGSNLSDHLSCGMVMATSRTDTLVAAETLPQLLAYVLRRRGLLTSNVGEAHAFLRADAASEGADIELIFAPVPFLDHGATNPPGHGYTIGAVLLQPESRGEVRLASADPFQPPVIDPRYLTSDRDTELLAWGLEQVIRIFATEPLGGVVTGPIRPDVVPATRQDRVDVLRAWAETLYHPAGTCAMGAGPQAVVDAQLRVRGVAGLRVADTSVMPTLNRGHTHAVAVMIGERAADLVRAA